jgi:hypothetical protein
MTRYGKITRTVKSFLVEVLGIGGTTQNRLVSPKGLYSKPKGENGLVIALSGGGNQDVVFALQKEIDLEDGDVYITDDKSYIHFHFKDGKIEVSAKELVFNLETFTINAGQTNFVGGSITHNGKPIDDTHQHTQTAGDDFGAGGITTPPNG